MTKRIAVIFASGFGSGFSPFAPGTFGTAVGMLFMWFYMQWSVSSPVYLILITLIITLFGQLSINQLPDTWKHDDQRIVIDEIAGYMLTLIFVPLNWYTLLWAFVLFRLFDIWKPLGIRSFDKMDSNWSVMLDDILAGIYANVVLQLGILLLPFV